MPDRERNEPEDAWLEERLSQYDGWLQERRIPVSSKVVPVRESLETRQWVLPTERVLDLIRNARSCALIDCDCRSHYRRCDNPVETCFLINDAADAYLENGKGRQVSLAEAEEVLRHADERGLVHLTIYNPHQYVYAVCNCCSCCCHDLQFLKLHGRSDMIARSEYVAETDAEQCVHCGDCVARCVFGARQWEGGVMVYNAAACYGCGLCVSVCSVGATTMLRRGKKG
jgi:Pyruvate/2-oxoacid:ferredoxin oxidoreductase delta subunit